MTQIDFYLVEQGSRDHFACRLVEKAHALGNQVFIHTPDESSARTLDEQLWTFRQNSFIPHEVLRPGAEPDCAVQLAFDVEPQGQGEVLINLSTDVPVFFSRFERVLEIFGADDAERNAARSRYSFYRDRGYKLAHHKVSS